MIDSIKQNLTGLGSISSVYKQKKKSPAYIVDNCFLSKIDQQQTNDTTPFKPFFPTPLVWGREETIEIKLRFKRFSVVEDILRPKSVILTKFLFS